MSESEVKFIDASDWISLDWYSSGGSRAKRVLQSPDGSEWYFKCSEKKPAKDGKPEKHYKYEFWSEVIAYQIGKSLGLNILRYDVAINNGEIGCISPLMIKRESEQLLEVGRYMTSLNPSFLPEDTTTRKEYTFQLLERTLDEFNLSGYWPFFLETILFDTIIGNTDRHQENWAFLGKSSFLTNSLTFIEKEAKGFERLPWVIKKIYRSLFNSKNELNTEGQQIKLQVTNIVGIAPIYDSGSSLGRELEDQRVEDLLKDERLLYKYAMNGKAEIHWENEKLTHYELVEKLKNSSYLESLVEAARFLDKWDESRVNEIVKKIDLALPEDWNSYLIPESRKELILKLLLLRLQKLKGLIND